MNIAVEPGAASFVVTCAAAGFLDYRLSVEEGQEGSVAEVLGAIPVGGSYSVSLKKYAVGSENTLQSDDLIHRYTEVLSNLDGRCVGVLLPEGCNNLVRHPKATFSDTGLRRDEIVKTLNRIAEVIRSFNFDVAIPCRIDDIQGNVWKNVDHDIIDLENMLTPGIERMLSDQSVSAMIKDSGKKVWFGRAGSLGGHEMPTAQLKTLGRLKSFARSAEVAYLWSEKASRNHHWSADGEFMLDKLGYDISQVLGL